MPLIARELIEEVRDLHPDFDERTVTSKSLLRVASATERQIFRHVVALNEYALAREEVIHYLGGALGRGAPLPPYILVIKVEVEGSCRRGREPVRLVNASEVATTGLAHFPSAYLVGGRLYATDRSRYNLEPSHGWAEGDRLIVTLVPLPEEPETPDDCFTVPETARDALVGAMARHAALMAGVDLDYRAEHAAALLQEAVDSLVDEGTTSSWKVQRVV